MNQKSKRIMVGISYGTALLISCLILAIVLINQSYRSYISSLVSPSFTYSLELIARGSNLAALSGSGSGLEGYWAFDDGGGTVAVEASEGAQHNGTLVNGPTWTTGKMGGAIQFDGIDDYVNIGNSNAYYSSAWTAGSFSAWIKTDNTSVANKKALSIMKAAGTNGITLGVNGTTTHKGYGAYRTGTNVLTYVETTSDVDDGAWHMLTWTISGTTGKLYLDGVLEKSVGSGISTAATFTSGAFPADIGVFNHNASSPQPWVGSIDDVRIYNRSLSQAEVTSLYDLAPVGEPTPTPSADSTPPSLPTSLSATAISSTEINLSWTASTDDTAVAGYRIYRGGTQINNSATNSYSDTGLDPQTSYTYTVSAYDGAGNDSGQSSGASATTQDPPPGSNEHYIRDGATGTTCADWGANACDALPATLIRNHTYYVAGGSYGQYIFDDANDGTKVITIKKATVTDHGYGANWDNAYDTQAVFSNLTFRTDYYTFDGVTGGGPGQWETGLGFRIYGGGRDIYFENFRHDIQIKHVDIENLGRYTPDAQGSNEVGIYSINGIDSILISHSYLHEINNAMLLTVGATNVTLQYSKLARNGFGGTLHREAWSATDHDNIIVRYNLFEDITGTAFIALVNGNGIADNWQIYGNVFWHSGNPSDVSVSALIYTKYASPTFISTTNWKIYNNIFLNINGTAIITLTDPTNNLIYNNIWYNNILGNTITTSGGTNDYNWYFNNIRTSGCSPACNLDGANNGAHNIIGTGNPFVGWQNRNFQLSLPITGLSLGSPYDFDGLGTARGLDGIWDMGAYEFSGALPSDTTPPSLSVITATDLTPTSAIISFVSDEPSTTQVEYGLTDSYGSNTSYSSSLTYIHSQTIYSLTPDTLYHYRVVSRDEDGNTQRSSDGTFATAASEPVIVISPVPTASPSNISSGSSGTSNSVSAQYLRTLSLGSSPSPSTSVGPLGTYTLKATKTGKGTGKIIGEGLVCGSICSVPVFPGTTIHLSAIPTDDSTFAGWGLLCKGQSCNVVMKGNATVQATFNLKPKSSASPSDSPSTVASAPSSSASPTLASSPAASVSGGSEPVTIAKNEAGSQTLPENGSSADPVSAEPEMNSSNGSTISPASIPIGSVLPSEEIRVPTFTEVAIGTVSDIVTTIGVQIKTAFGNILDLIF